MKTLFYLWDMNETQTPNTMTEYQIIKQHRDMLEKGVDFLEASQIAVELFIRHGHEFKKRIHRDSDYS